MLATAAYHTNGNSKFVTGGCRSWPSSSVWQFSGCSFDLWSRGHRFSHCTDHYGPGTAAEADVPLSPSSMTWYWRNGTVHSCTNEGDLTCCIEP